MRLRLLPILKAMILAGLTLAASDVAGTCQMEKKAELALGYADGLPTAEAKINGTTVVMGLDTGAQSLVTPQIAAELRLMPGWSRTLAKGVTATFVAGQVILRDLEFAGRHYNWKAVAKIKLWRPKQPIESKGSSGFDRDGRPRGYDLDLDFPQHKLTLYSVKGCTATPPSDFTDFRAIPFKINDQRSILFPIELDGRKLTAILDTGSVLHSITRAGSKKAGLTAAMLSADPQIETIGAGGISARFRS